MKRTDRIRAMEEKFDKALEAAEALDRALENFESAIPETEELIAYYESGLWRRDYAADVDGKLPQDLKRGVLSQDGVYNLIADYQRLKERIKD